MRLQDLRQNLLYIGFNSTEKCLTHRPKHGSDKVEIVTLRQFWASDRKYPPLTKCCSPSPAGPARVADGTLHEPCAVMQMTGHVIRENASLALLRRSKGFFAVFAFSCGKASKLFAGSRRSIRRRDLRLHPVRPATVTHENLSASYLSSATASFLFSGN